MARVRSLLRIKALQDEVKRQAAELDGWNATLEARVQACVAEIEGLGRLKRFFSAPVAEAIVSERRSLAARAASARHLLPSSSTCAASRRSRIAPSPRT